MKVSVGSFVLILGLAIAMFGAGFFLRAKLVSKRSPTVSESSLQREMDAYCTAKLNDYNSTLSPDDKIRETFQSFFSEKLHTCIQIDVIADPKDAGAMNFAVSDLTYGFIAPPKWHPSERPLHIVRSDYGRYHHLHAEGYWAPVSSDPGQQPVAEANAVDLTCDFSDNRRIGDDPNVCTENQGYTQFGGIHSETQAYRIASWNRDEVIATDAERGITGATTTTLLIHPDANEVEVIDRTRMDEKQPDLFKGMAGKSYGDHYELKGGMYLIDTQGVLFQCDEYGVVTDMRLDVVEKHHGDVVNVPETEWNAGSKADHKFTRQECDTAMQKKLSELR